MKMRSSITLFSLLNLLSCIVIAERPQTTGIDLFPRMYNPLVDGRFVAWNGRRMRGAELWRNLEIMQEELEEKVYRSSANWQTISEEIDPLGDAYCGEGGILRRFLPEACGQTFIQTKYFYAPTSALEDLENLDVGFVTYMNATLKLVITDVVHGVAGQWGRSGDPEVTQTFSPAFDVWGDLVLSEWRVLCSRAHKDISSLEYVVFRDITRRPTTDIMRYIVQRSLDPNINSQEIRQDEDDFFALVGSEYGSRVQQLIGRHANSFATREPTTQIVNGVKSIGSFQIFNFRMLGIRPVGSLFIKLADVDPRPDTDIWKSPPADPGFAARPGTREDAPVERAAHSTSSKRLVPLSIPATRNGLTSIIRATTPTGSASLASTPRHLVSTAILSSSTTLAALSTTSNLGTTITARTTTSLASVTSADPKCCGPGFWQKLCPCVGALPSLR